MFSWFKSKKKKKADASDAIPGVTPSQRVILFVCTANLSRSPMAEAMMRKLMADKPNYVVLSAGTKSAPGFDPTPETLTVLQYHHYDTSGLKTKPLTTALIKRADYIFVMSEVHHHAVLKMVPTAAEKCLLLRDLEDREADRGEDVPDPHERPLDEFIVVFKMLERLLPKAVRFIEDGPTDEWLDWYDFYRRSNLGIGG